MTVAFAPKRIEAAAAKVEGQLPGVQMLRGAAALTVVFGHAQGEALRSAEAAGGTFERIFWLPWGAGVDLFFVISGFIMVYASERLFARAGAGQEFLARRLIRIVPLYWAILTLYILLHGVFGSAEHVGNITRVSVLASYLFWPFDGFGDGVPRPVYALGWTLNYEMFFYALFALFVSAPRRRAVIGVAGVLAALCVLGATFHPVAAPLKFWTQGIALEFALGMGLALALRSGLTLPSSLRWLLAVGGLAVLSYDPLGSGGRGVDWIMPNDFSRVLAFGLPAAAIVAAAALGGVSSTRSRLAPSAVLLGDASYALYLLHPLVIGAVGRLGEKAHVAAWATPWALIAIECVVSVAVAIAVHRLIEKPVTRWLQAWRGQRAIARKVQAA